MSSQDESNLAALSEINNKFVTQGQTLPAVTLPDGSKIQTGTVGALLMNIKLYDRVYAGESVEGEFGTCWSCEQGANEIGTGFTKEGLEQALTVPIPTLAKVGLMDLFPPDEWIAGSSAGRKFVGAKAKEMGY